MSIFRINVHIYSFFRGKFNYKCGRSGSFIVQIIRSGDLYKILSVMTPFVWLAAFLLSARAAPISCMWNECPSTIAPGVVEFRDKRSNYIVWLLWFWLSVHGCFNGRVNFNYILTLPSLEHMRVTKLGQYSKHHDLISCNEGQFT